MAVRRVKVTVNLPFAKQLLPFFNKRGASQVAKVAVKTAKDQISKGVSPVKGQGRFEAYVAQRTRSFKAATRISKDKSGTAAMMRAGRERARSEQAKKKLYPNSVMADYPQKKLRPVNLFLSGDMLKALKAKRIPSSRLVAIVRYGIFSKSSKIRDRAEGNNEGIPSNNVPKRQFIPNGKGDKFSALVSREIRKAYLDFMSKFVREQNKK